jgi:hypothetical protein
MAPSDSSRIPSPPVTRGAEKSSYVKTIRPQGGAPENLSGAVNFAAELDDMSGALIGHFVDQARRSTARPAQGPQLHRNRAHTARDPAC